MGKSFYAGLIGSGITATVLVIGYVAISLVSQGQQAARSVSPAPTYQVGTKVAEAPDPRPGSFALSTAPSPKPIIEEKHVNTEVSDEIYGGVDATESKVRRSRTPAPTYSDGGEIYRSPSRSTGGSSGGRVQVKGYTRKGGVHVSAHTRSAPHRK